jgi:hypothetical protein
MSDVYGEQRKTFHLFGTLRDILGDDRGDASSLYKDRQLYLIDFDLPQV